MATALQAAVRSTALPRNCGTSGSRTHRSPRFELGRFAGLRTVLSFLTHSAPPMGFEPTISTLTGWRAQPDCSARALFLRFRISDFVLHQVVAQEGFEPSASLVLSKSGLPVAYRASFQFRGLESNQRPPRSERGVTTSSNCPGVVAFMASKPHRHNRDGRI